jgi:hypothetical protein
MISKIKSKRELENYKPMSMTLISMDNSLVTSIK